MTETHFYDGRLSPIKDPLKADLERAGQKTQEEKMISFRALRQQLPEETHRNFDVIVQDIGNNYDSTNDLHADDLLYLCSELTGDSSFVDLLTAQLVEMSTGICAQGRTHRLLQILWAFQGK